MFGCLGVWCLCCVGWLFWGWCGGGVGGWWVVGVVVLVGGVVVWVWVWFVVGGVWWLRSVLVLEGLSILVESVELGSDFAGTTCFAWDGTDSSGT
ncbi:hypothetical protein RA276_27690, partial [Pseudomonas syringae pv. tagetis]